MLGVSADELSSWSADEVDTLNAVQGQFSNLRVRKLIDEGASSQVWEGEWAGARVVIKVLREQEARSARSRRSSAPCMSRAGRPECPA